MSEITNNLNEINNYALSCPQKLVDASELRYSMMLSSLVDRINSDNRNTMLMLAGPSSAGKTTTAKKIQFALNSLGHTSYIISLDDFYLGEKDAPVLPDGTSDFETVHALDLPLFNSTVSNLMTYGESDIPIFDFPLSQRSDKFNHLSLLPGDTVIFEGLHALNPLITQGLPSDTLLKIYISVSTRIYDDEKNVVLSKRALRFIRRLVRDFKYRGSSVDETYAIWQNVIAGEDKYMFPFRDLADIKINSFHPYEPCVLRDEALDILNGLSADSKYYEECHALTDGLKRFVSLPHSMMPMSSLLREFAGKDEFDIK